MSRSTVRAERTVLPATGTLFFNYAEITISSSKILYISNVEIGESIALDPKYLAGYLQQVPCEGVNSEAQSDRDTRGTDSHNGKSHPNT